MRARLSHASNRVLHTDAAAEEWTNVTLDQERVVVRDGQARSPYTAAFMIKSISRGTIDPLRLAQPIAALPVG